MQAISAGAGELSAQAISAGGQCKRLVQTDSRQAGDPANDPGGQTAGHAVDKGVRDRFAGGFTIFLIS
jgi:hypothetical protein